MAQLRADLLAGRANCTGIVDAYIQRIKAYDGTTGLNAVRALAPGTRARAAELDRRLAAALAAGTQASLPPLFCVPLLVKDNIDVAGLPTTAGSVALANNTRAVDATAVARLQAAGAVVLAKANMAEWALSPRVSVSSLGGAVRNAYDADRTPGGSSGGSAAGVAASFAAASLGTDTGNSVRGPASHAGLVGVRPSFGLVPRTGVVPLDLTSDTVGPLARTVGDAAALLDAMAGPDPADPATMPQAAAGAPAGAALPASRPQTYADAALAGASAGLGGVRLGVLACVLDGGADADVASLFSEALQDLAAAGAVVDDAPFTLPLPESARHKEDAWSCQLGMWPSPAGRGGWAPLACGDRVTADVGPYLAGAAPGVGLRSLEVRWAEAVVGVGGWVVDGRPAGALCSGCTVLGPQPLNNSVQHPPLLPPPSASGHF